VPSIPTKCEATPLFWKWESIPACVSRFVIPVDLTIQLVSACFDLLVHAQTRLFSQCSFGVLV
jgi:hypothetical protein